MQRSPEDIPDQNEAPPLPDRLEPLKAAILAILHALVEVLGALAVTALLTVVPPLLMLFLIKDHPIHNGVLYFAAVWLFLGGIAFLLLAARWVHLLADRISDALGILPRAYGLDSRTRPPKDAPPPPKRNHDQN